jgi:hypothetical protein
MDPQLLLSMNIARWYIFKPKNPNLGKFYRVLLWKMISYMAIWSLLLPFGIFCCHLVYFVTVGYILLPFGIFCGHLVYISRFGMLCHEKSGSSAFYIRDNFENTKTVLATLNVLQ